MHTYPGRAGTLVVPDACLRAVFSFVNQGFWVPETRDIPGNFSCREVQGGRDHNTQTKRPKEERSRETPHNFVRRLSVDVARAVRGQSHCVGGTDSRMDTSRDLPTGSVQARAPHLTRITRPGKTTTRDKQKETLPFGRVEHRKGQTTPKHQ